METYQNRIITRISIIEVELIEDLLFSTKMLILYNCTYHSLRVRIREIFLSACIFLIQHTEVLYYYNAMRDREIEIEQWHPGELVQFSLSVNCIASPGLKKNLSGVWNIATIGGEWYKVIAPLLWHVRSGWPSCGFQLLDINAKVVTNPSIREIAYYTKIQVSAQWEDTLLLYLCRTPNLMGYDH